MNTKSINHLCKLWILILEQSLTNMSGNPANIDDDDDDDFENFLKEECGLRSTTVISNQPVNIESILQSFDTFDYWTSKKNEHPELHELVQVTLSIPATQVSVK
ncbi:Dimer Tnp hAT domain-containing protein [Aphis craccivora]|uniref:Dimer Tnp hAT domain-containing protein n=1 Tax=Aphis craccivora TaxID=307492 RepID=A0A6G0Z344_APHCR|nr:Dimer Tnp hAT domain-containing protein [Aphis craccivora]